MTPSRLRRTRRHRARRPAVGLVLALAFGLGCAACASAGDERDYVPRAHPDYLTIQELDARTHDNAFDAVQALRPHWIRQRGRVSLNNPRAGEVVIYMDGTRAGGLDFLRRLHVANVAGMQYFSASEATTRFGTGHAGGVIYVTTHLGLTADR
jgi:hypothetical protein